MREYIIELIKTYGIEPVLLALLINILTGLIKIPIKKLADKLKDSSKVTRFIVFLPILLGFGLTTVYFELFEKGYIFNNKFITLWIAATSLSLTFYAIYEKLFPSKKKIASDSEVKATEKILHVINEFLNDFMSLPISKIDEIKAKKIVLRGSNNVETKTEEEQI